MTPRTLAFLPAILIAVACAPSGAPPTRDAHRALGPFLDSLMVAHRVPGISFALFDDRGVLYEHVGGVKDVTTGEPVGPGTVFEAASISKPVMAHIAMSLAREGAVDLDAPLTAMVPRLPEVAYDPRSARLTPRLLLSHQGGFPNWRSRMRFEATSYDALFAPGDTLRFVNDPGARHRYSGEGYVLLQRVVELHTGQSLDSLARRRVFDPLRMTRSSFRFDSAMRRDASMGHDAEGRPDKWIVHLALASSSLLTTAGDLARFGSHLAAQLRTGGPYAELAAPVVRASSPRDSTAGLVRQWGTGLGVVDDGARRYLYHTGNNVIFIADFIYGVDENLGYALLTNSANGSALAAAVERRIFGRNRR